MQSKTDPSIKWHSYKNENKASLPVALSPEQIIKSKLVKGLIRKNTNEFIISIPTYI